MALNVKVSRIIETLIPEFDAIDVFIRTVPEGANIDSNTKYRAAYDLKERAISRINIVADVLDVSGSVMWETVLTARRLYNRTGGQQPMTEEDTEGIWNTVVKNNRKE